MGIQKGQYIASSNIEYKIVEFALNKNKSKKTGQGDRKQQQVLVSIYLDKKNALCFAFERTNRLRQ